MEKDRISAVIIQNKKLLLITGYDELFYWTPGGKIDANESHKEALKRELNEELSIKPTSIDFYLSYGTINEITKEKQKVYCYLARIIGQPKPKKEITKVLWYSKKNFEADTPKLSKSIKEYLIPKLIGDGLL